VCERERERDLYLSLSLCIYLLISSSEAGYHLHCAANAPKKVSEVDWICQACVKNPRDSLGGAHGGGSGTKISKRESGAVSMRAAGSESWGMSDCRGMLTSSPSALIEAEDLDLPLTARRSKAAETAGTTQKTQKMSPERRRRSSGGERGGPAAANASAAKKQRVSIKASDEEKGVDLESDAAVCIRSALMQLCDELGEQALAGAQFTCFTGTKVPILTQLAETTPKLLRRKLETQLKKPQGALNEWKKAIREWYDLGEQVKRKKKGKKKALREHFTCSKASKEVHSSR